MASVAQTGISVNQCADPRQPGACGPVAVDQVTLGVSAGPPRGQRRTLDGVARRGGKGHAASAPAKYYGGNLYTPQSEASLDWGTFTFHGVDPLVLIECFGGGELISDYHKNYYDQVYKLSLGGLLMAHSERQDMGVCVSLAGEALDNLRAAWKMERDGLLLETIASFAKFGQKDARVTCSRLDVAFDDYKGLLDLDQIVEYTENEWYTSCWHGYGVIRSKKGRGKDQPTACGVTYGSRLSESYLRIYDKRAEQIQKGNPDVPEHHIRVELELKGDSANVAFWSSVGQGGVSWLAAILRDKLNFRQAEGSDSNQRRWQVCEWWLVFLGDVRDKLHVVRKIVKQTIESAKRWLVRQAMPTMAAVAQLADGTVWIRDQMWAAADRINPVLRLAIEGAM